MYLIIQSKWIRGSSQNGERLVNSCSRLREARGLVRHHFKSHLEMVMKHMYWDDFDLSEEECWIVLADEEGIFYYSKFFFKEDV